MRTNLKKATPLIDTGTFWNFQYVLNFAKLEYAIL